MHKMVQLVQEAATGQLDVSPEKLATGINTAPLAWAVVILLGVVAYLGKLVVSGYEARIALMEKMYAQLLETHTGTVTLGLKFSEGLDVLDKAIDRSNKEDA